MFASHRKLSGCEEDTTAEDYMEAAIKKAEQRQYMRFRSKCLSTWLKQSERKPMKLVDNAGDDQGIAMHDWLDAKRIVFGNNQIGRCLPV